MKNEYPAPTNELSRLLDAMVSANDTFKQVVKVRGPLDALCSTEYQNSRAAWRAYWAAVDSWIASTPSARATTTVNA